MMECAGRHWCSVFEARPEGGLRGRRGPRVCPTVQFKSRRFTFAIGIRELGLFWGTGGTVVWRYSGVDKGKRYERNSVSLMPLSILFRKMRRLFAPKVM
jgi:hypothetical protein